AGQCGVGSAVGGEDEAVSGMQIVVIAFVGGIGQQTYGQIAMPRADDFAVANQQGRHVAAVDIFQFSVALDAGDDHGRVFFADVFVGEEAIGSGHDFGQGHASGELGINHS